ncbi:MAG: N-acetyl-gamma-glutamyl-phosphate reductase, partial [Pseudomonadota bacterium]
APDHPVTVNAVSGYTGGGKAMIRDYEDGTAPAFQVYGLGLSHKHVPELQRFAALTRQPIFLPSVGNFPQGMLVSVPLHLETLKGRARAADLRDLLRAHYAGSAVGTEPLVRVADDDDAAYEAGRLVAPTNDTDRMTLYVFGRDDVGHAVLVAQLDNLGKGASGAAVQNMQLALGML